MIFSNTGLSIVLTFGARTNLQTLNCLCKIYPIVPVHEYYTIGVNLYYQNKLLQMDQCLELTSYHGYLLPRIYLQRQRSFKGVGGNNGQTASIRRALSLAALWQDYSHLSVNYMYNKLIKLPTPMYKYTQARVQIPVWSVQRHK